MMRAQSSRPVSTWSLGGVDIPGFHLFRVSSIYLTASTVVWFVTSALTQIRNKQALLFGVPATSLVFTQLSLGALFSFVVDASGRYPSSARDITASQPTKSDDRRLVMLAGFLNAFGHVSTMWATDLIPVGLVHAIRSSECYFVALILSYGGFANIKARHWLIILVSCLGLFIYSISDVVFLDETSSFRMCSGILFAVAANGSFAWRNIIVNISTEVSTARTDYGTLCRYGAVLLILPSLTSGVSIEKLMSRVNVEAACLHVVYSSFSFYVLSSVKALAHSILKVLSRVIIIIATWFSFDGTLDLARGGGLLITIIGIVSYSFMDGIKSTTVTLVQSYRELTSDGTSKSNIILYGAFLLPLGIFSVFEAHNNYFGISSISFEPPDYGDSFGNFSHVAGFFREELQIDHPYRWTVRAGSLGNLTCPYQNGTGEVKVWHWKPERGYNAGDSIAPAIIKEAINRRFSSRECNVSVRTTHDSGTNQLILVGSEISHLPGNVVFGQGTKVLASEVPKSEMKSEKPVIIVGTRGLFSAEVVHKECIDDKKTACLNTRPVRYYGTPNVGDPVLTMRFLFPGFYVPEERRRGFTVVFHMSQKNCCLIVSRILDGNLTKADLDESAICGVDSDHLIKMKARYGAVNCFSMWNERYRD